MAASLDQKRRSRSLCATQPSDAVSEVVNEVTNMNTLARSGSGGDVDGSSIPPNGSHVLVAKVTVEISGKLPPLEGDDNGYAASIGATVGGGIKVQTRATASGLVDATGGDNEGGEKNESSKGKVVTTMKTISMETIVISDGSSSDIEDEDKHGTLATLMHESSDKAQESVVLFDVVRDKC
jgi:hypothetical protein